MNSGGTVIRVLPDRQLPRANRRHIEAVKLLLIVCALSIHLVGGSYGAVPDGPTMKSAIMLQNELAAQRSKSGGLTRLIWLPDGTRSEQPRQQEFIDALHQDAEVQFVSDLITQRLAELKLSIHATLKKLQTPVTPQPEPLTDAADRSQLIYLICTEKDRKDTVPVANICVREGFDVSIPAFEGDATAIWEAHQQLLANCDGVILYYGAEEEAWKRTLDNDLKKMPSYRSGRPVRAKYTYLAVPDTTDKQELIDFEEPDLIHGLQEFSEATMTAFVQAMKKEAADEHAGTHRREDESVSRIATVPRSRGISVLWSGKPGRFDGRQIGGDTLLGRCGNLRQRQKFLGQLRTASGSSRRLDVACGDAMADGSVRPGSEPIAALARALAADGVLFRNFKAGGLCWTKSSKRRCE